MAYFALYRRQFPLIEIALFIQVGELLGLGPTLANRGSHPGWPTWLSGSQGRTASGLAPPQQMQRSQRSHRAAHPALMILFPGALLLNHRILCTGCQWVSLLIDDRACARRSCAPYTRSAFGRSVSAATAGSSRLQPGRTRQDIPGLPSASDRRGLGGGQEASRGNKHNALGMVPITDDAARPLATLSLGAALLIRQRTT